MCAMYAHRGDTRDNALSLVLRAVSKDTGLMPDLQMLIAFVYGFRILEHRSLLVRVQRGVPNHLAPIHTLGPLRIASTGSYDTNRIVVSGHQATATPPQHVGNETKMLAKASERL